MERTQNYLRHKFADYYRTTTLIPPTELEKREFAFLYFDKNYMVRHLGFRNGEALEQFLVAQAPKHAYHSAAYYEMPNARTMADKKWLGADLIFDLDADHIEGSEGLSYEQMLKIVKKETLKLVERFLIDDFGFDGASIKINFSGARGYHIHLQEPKAQQLDSSARREIVDYITGEGLNFDLVFPKVAFKEDGKGKFKKIWYKYEMPDKTTPGWKSKIRTSIELLIDKLEKLDKNDRLKLLMSQKGVGAETAKNMHADLFEGAPSGIDKMRAGVFEVFGADKTRNRFFELVKRETSVQMGGETDEPVTSDVKRLIRATASLHGKTGLRVMPLSVDGLKEFEPLRDAIVFSDAPISVIVERPMQLSLGSEHFDLRTGVIELPEYAAIFSMCRGLAKLK